eukprot:1477956-Pyramimonas_sp.AAC.1
MPLRAQNWCNWTELVVELASGIVGRRTGRSLPRMLFSFVAFLWVSEGPPGYLGAFIGRLHLARASHLAGTGSVRLGC